MNEKVLDPRGFTLSQVALPDVLDALHHVVCEMALQRRWRAFQVAFALNHTETSAVHVLFSRSAFNAALYVSVNARPFVLLNQHGRVQILRQLAEEFSYESGD